MTSLNNDPNKELAEDLAKSLQVTTSLIQSLLQEIRDNATSLAVFKERLNSLSDKVNTISSIIKIDNGPGSLATKVAINEKEIKDVEDELKLILDDLSGIKINFASDKQDIYKKIEETKQELKHSFGLIEKTEAQQNRELSIQRLKTLGVMLPGIISLVLLIAKAMGVELPFTSK